MYQRLVALQGVHIPHLRFHGCSGEMYVMATTYIEGKHPEFLTQEIADLVRDVLAAYGVDHGDLREPNVIIDGTGRLWIIDFGMSSII